VAYKSLEHCLIDLERNGQLVRIKEQVDPYLEMAAIQLRVYEQQGPAVLFENVKGSKYRAVSNLFGSLSRSEFIFRHQLQAVQQLIELKNNPIKALKNPLKYTNAILGGLKALPLRNPISKPVLANKINISDLPLITHWPMDGGAFVTLPQVYSEDVDSPGIMQANLGMYRIQLNGNDYKTNKEIGLHYQLHRGIGVHQSKANERKQPFKVSVFVGGPPSHTVSAVMPLPEGMSEMTFAGALGGRRFRYCYRDSYCISTDADFVICGEVVNNEVKPEGPFGDHLGYYSLQHPFPVMKVHQVYAKHNAIWPFTVVGRPPQEDTSFGQLIHKITGNAIAAELPGVQEVHAVDAAGVHPLLLAIGSERYTPFSQATQPAELLTQANHILGTGQLSLAKFLFITADPDKQLHCHNVEAYFTYLLSRVQWQRDVHFYTNTSIDTLDYSGTSLNQGSKVVIAAYGAIVRTLCTQVPQALSSVTAFGNAQLCMPGVIALQAPAYSNKQNANREMEVLNEQLQHLSLSNVAIIIICNDSSFAAANLRNWLWASFTKCNPAQDIYGINAFTEHKHWGCNGPLVIDARTKPHHAPELVVNDAVNNRIDKYFAKGGALYQSKNL
jgi:4-hydroxy-3-polyprenylbenzoate decarboxylase